MAEKHGNTALEQRLEQALAENAQMRQDMAAMRETLDRLAGRVGEQPTMLEQQKADQEAFEHHKKWAMLSAQEKSQLVANQLYGPSTGTTPYECQLVYLPRRTGGASGGVETPPSEFPRVRLHAHNDHEARALYQSLCGINRFDQDVCKLECASVAA